MFFCSFVEKTHRSSLTTHCSKTVAASRLCRRWMCGGRMNTTGSSPRGYSPFRTSRPSDATTLYIITKKRKRLKDEILNSRGLSSLRFIMSVYKWRLKDGNRQRRLFKRYSLNAHCSQLIGQNLWSSVASVSSVCQSLNPTRSPLYVKYFYSFPQNTHWCQNEQKPLKIVQKQT